jgi:ribonuclease BN (tRNA processing enzyme)
MLAPPGLGQTCLLVSWPELDGTLGRLLVDCGGGMDIINRLKGRRREITWIVITHLHPDHVGGLAGLALLNYFSLKPRLKLYLPAGNFRELLWMALAPGLQTLEGQEASLETFFEPIEVRLEEWVRLGPNLDMMLFPTRHFMNGTSWQPSYGLQLVATLGVPDGERYVRFMYSGDTRFTPDLMMSRYEWADVIIHDCETYGETEASGVHARLDQLEGLPDPIRAKMWLVHYNSNFGQYVGRVEQHGFPGFVQPGQIFDLGRLNSLLLSHDPLQGSGHEQYDPAE